nr:cuticle-degrading protease [Quercus suber]
MLAVLPWAVANPILSSRETKVIPDKWIVRVRDGVSASILSSTISQVSSILGTQAENTYNFGTFRGFSISGAGPLVQALSSIAHITSIEPDTTVYASILTSQHNAPYGLTRISHRQKGANEYVYDNSAGAGTFSYIIDTGIYTAHNDFGGRATFAANFAGDNNKTDGNGHGTHVAGTTGGTTYGVAKRTTLVAVKVLDASGSGANSAVLAGINFVVNDAKAKSRLGKAVANLSLGGPFSSMTNDAVTEAVNQGLFLAVAAGNSGLPTFTSSPGSAAAVCTVGATDAADARASFSNFGSLVDLFAPGVDIISAWINGPDDTNTISGTSMAAPHVAGLGAYILGLEGSMTPQALCARLKDLATKNAISRPGLFSPNTLAYNGNGA